MIGNKRRRSIPANTPLQQDLADILAAMTAAIDPCSLMGNRLSLGQPAGQLRCDDQPVLVAGGDAVDLDRLNRIVVVGGGKAAGGFAGKGCRFARTIGQRQAGNPAVVGSCCSDLSGRAVG